MRLNRTLRAWYGVSRPRAASPSARARTSPLAAAATSGMAASCSPAYSPLLRIASSSVSGAFGSIARLVAGVRRGSRCVTGLTTPAPRRDPPGHRFRSPEPQTDWNPAAFRTMISEKRFRPQESPVSAAKPTDPVSQTPPPPSPAYPGGENAPGYRLAFQAWMLLFLL